MEPYWALRTGSVPLCLKFNIRPSLEFAHTYLENTNPYDYINMMLMNHGTDSIDIPGADEWEIVLDRAQVKGSFVGLDTERFPRDFASMINYYTGMQKIPARYPLPAPLTLGQFDEFLANHGDHYEVDWLTADIVEERAAD